MTITAAPVSLVATGAARRARRTAVGTAVSPNTLTDTAMTLYFSFTMLADLCVIYNLRAGRLGTAVLLARVFLSLPPRVVRRGELAAYVWQFEPAATSRPRRITKAALMNLGVTAESKALSKDLKRRGWTFVGPTTIYAFMQAMGLVNDHIDGCHVRRSISTLPSTASAAPKKVSASG